MIRSGSYSKLIDFEQCPYRVKLKHVDCIPEEKSPAADRGTAIHQMAEDFVRGKGRLVPSELIKFHDEFLVLRREFKAKNVSLEGEWGLDKDWLPCDYKKAWLRMKADAVFFMSDTKAIVIDYKTGKRFGNELKHGEQVQLYAIAAFILYPKLEEITVELWYLDIDELHSMTYTRMQALRYVQSYDKRFIKLTTAKDFPANPNVFTCKWCAYGPNKGRQCEFGTLQSGNTLGAYRKKFG